MDGSSVGIAALFFGGLGVVLGLSLGGVFRTARHWANERSYRRWRIVFGLLEIGGWFLAAYGLGFIVLILVETAG